MARFSSPEELSGPRSGPDSSDCYVPNVGCILASAELFDPGPGTFSRTGDMTTARRMHTATLLADGRILIAGGFIGRGAIASAELYDPSTGTFTATGNMMTSRGGHSAILLPNGNVLMVGGYGTPGYPDLAPAELYDPISGRFSAAGAYVGRGGCDFCAPATLLADGTVLFPGQYPAQIYDPVTNTFSVAGMMISDHSTAALLLSGKVLFAGGDNGRSTSAELYDPVRGTFTSTGNMAWSRVWHTLNLLPNGMVLTTGGETESGGSAAGSDSAELYDPSAGIFLATGKMAARRETHTATLLNDGRVLIAGGVSWENRDLPRNPSERGTLHSRRVECPRLRLFLCPAMDDGQGTIFHAGTSHIAGPDDPAAAGEDLRHLLHRPEDGQCDPSASSHRRSSCRQSSHLATRSTAPAWTKCGYECRAESQRGQPCRCA